MRDMKNLIEKYNTEESVFMISPYPKKGEVYSTGTSGIASFAKNTALHLPTSVIVLANYETRPTAYEEKNTLVVRSFKKNTLGLWFNLIKTMLRFPKVKTVLIQFDFALYGDILTSSLTLPFLIILRFLGYKVHVVAHSIVLDVFELTGHLGLANKVFDAIKGHILNIIFRLFYIVLGHTVNNVIILEELLKYRLSKYINKEKIISIPIGVDEDLTSISKKDARQKLGLAQDEQLVIFFGFINWFKGADFFVEAYKQTNKILGKKTRFIVAGGKSATLDEKPYYQTYFNKLLEEIDQSQNIQISGRIPQDKIHLYFSAADLVVFPYRYFLSASAVLSLVFSYQKPFIISHKLKDMFSSNDFISAFADVGLSKHDITFALNRVSCLNITKKVLKNGLKKKLIHLSAVMKNQRSWTKMGYLYHEALSSSPAVEKSWILGYSK